VRMRIDSRNRQRFWQWRARSVDIAIVAISHVL
jgi:hypothetical protein